MHKAAKKGTQEICQRFLLPILFFFPAETSFFLLGEKRVDILPNRLGKNLLLPVMSNFFSLVYCTFRRYASTSYVLSSVSFSVPYLILLPPNQPATYSPNYSRMHGRRTTAAHFSSSSSSRDTLRFPAAGERAGRSVTQRESLAAEELVCGRCTVAGKGDNSAPSSSPRLVPSTFQSPLPLSRVSSSSSSL